MLKGNVSLYGYRLLLRNLLPVYRAMEAGLERHRESGALRRFALPQMYRSEAIESDLKALQDARELPLLPSATRYETRVAEAADRKDGALIGHAYARYLGDLSGGQILKRLLSKSLELEALSFFEFPKISDMNAFKAEFRLAIEETGAELPTTVPVTDAAVDAFRLNIALSQAVRNAA